MGKYASRWTASYAVILVLACGQGDDSRTAEQQSGRSETALEGTSRGSDFWLMFTQNYNTAPTLTLFIAGDEATTGTVEIPGLGFSSDFTVTPGDVTSVAIPAAAQVSGGGAIGAKGIHVTAGADVSVYGLNRIQYTTDAFLALPTQLLGTEYLVMAYPVYLPGLATELGVVATQDGTAVIITPRVSANGHPAGVPFTVTLDQGQTYQLQSGTYGADLTGTRVAADKPVAVVGGNVCTNVPNNSYVACDHVVEQLPPTSAWGKRFATMPLATRRNGDTFRFLAAADGTQITINGVTVATLAAGAVYQSIVSGPAFVEASEPILVAQYSNSSSYDGVTSDPFMMLIPPYEQFLGSYTVSTPASGFNNYINLVAPSSAVGALTIDGIPVGASSFVAIGATGFSGAAVPVTSGSHVLAAPLPFGAFVYGFASYDSYGYPGGMSLAAVATVTTLALAPPTGSAEIGSQHCVTATVLDQYGAAVPGVRVDFAVTGATTFGGFATADGAGTAQFCYSGASAGDDAIVASVGTVTANATMTWTSTGECTTPPAITCGADVSVGNDAGQCAARAAPAAPSVAYSCGEGSVAAVRGDGLALSAAYPVGVTTVQWTATDAAGNTAACAQRVSVADAEPPALAAPADIEVASTVAGTCSSAPVSFSVGVTDNCPGAALSSLSHASGTAFPWGDTTVTAGAIDGAGNTAGGAFHVIVRQVAATTAVSATPNPRQYSDPVTYTATITPAACAGSGAAAASVNFDVSSQAMGSASLAESAGALGGTLPDVPLLQPSPYGTAPTEAVAPGGHTVTATFTGANPNFTLSSATTELTVTQEDALAYYTGALFASTGSADSGVAVVTLAATIKDVAADPISPAYDPAAGDIRNAMVTFVDRDAGDAVLCTAAVGLVTAADPTVGTAACTFVADLGASNAQTLRVGVIVGGFYLRDAPADDTIVTVARPIGTGFITGGGFLDVTRSAGAFAAAAGTKNNFGFNVKYNKARTNLQGNLNSIVRTGGRVYQVKSNALTSLVVDAATGVAVFNGKASINDVTDPLLAVGIEGNALLQVTMTDRGEPGTADSIAITVWNKNGGLWFTSAWDGTQSVEQTLGGGNLVVH